MLTCCKKKRKEKKKKKKLWCEQEPSYHISITMLHVPITPNLPSSCSYEIVGDYVEKQMLVHHFSHCYNRKMPMDGVGIRWCDQRLVHDVRTIISEP